jgi:hypothetical protein
VGPPLVVDDAECREAAARLSRAAERVRPRRQEARRLQAAAS